MNANELLVQKQATLNVVPTDYAQRAMASLMQLHSELMEEKERRVDLYRRLMEKEQAIAELRMYVKLLEEKLGKVEQTQGAGADERPDSPMPDPIPLRRPNREVPRSPPPPRRAEPPPAIRPKASATDGWKTW